MDRQQLAKKYDLIHNWLYLLDIVLTLLCIIMLIVGGNSGVSGALSSYLSNVIPNIWLVIAIYVVIISVCCAVLFLPLNFYEGYILEHKFKLSNQSVLEWIKNFLKSFAVSLILSLIIVEVTYLLLRHTGEYWWILAGCAWILFSIILNHLAPVVLIPIFFKLTPLENQDLVSKLKALAEKAGTNILGVFEINLSKKTKKANAAFTGMGRTKRILLADTLLKEYSDEQIETILAHEMGHYYYKHLWKLLATGIATTFIGLWIGNIVLKNCADKLEYPSISDISTLPLLILVLFGFMLITMPITNTFSRRLERQADIFSIKLTNAPHIFIESMRKLAGQNLADVNPNPIIHFLLHSHPSISERISMAEKYINNQ